MGATVKAVCDGAEAVEEVAAAAARGKTYSGVLMDCRVWGWGMGDEEGAGAGLTHACSQMPRLDGFSATQRIREEEKASASGAHLFNIALTAHAFVWSQMEISFYRTFLGVVMGFATSLYLLWFLEVPDSRCIIRSPLVSSMK